MLCRRIKSAVRTGSVEYRNSQTYQQKQQAFVELARLLTNHRDLVIRLITVAVPWCTGEEPRPLMWAGRPVLRSIGSDIDCLHTSTALCDWYGFEYPFTDNPFVITVRDIPIQ